ncbi:DUF4352 domain-containing protein [Enterococcus sp.]|uniref:DUF4352 domain-containing protein n=1 Tax=Enterococcus sp. TaxID=35783 RepID=UPI0020523FB8|nr:DUF4352 domain-containing protein [Enterococcus sp.]DAE49331.1 MAG TPA: protein of unknown function (DUF4352) [Caudoviricetes sp.]
MKKWIVSGLILLISVLLAGCGPKTKEYGGVELPIEDFDKLENVLDISGAVAVALDNYDYTDEKTNVKITAKLNTLEEEYQKLKPKEKDKAFSILLSSENPLSINEIIQNTTDYQRDPSTIERTMQYTNLEEFVNLYSTALTGSEKKGKEIQKQFFKDIDLSESFYEGYYPEETYESSSEEIEDIVPTTYTVGDSVAFTGEDGESISVTIDKVSKYEGDEWSEPTGPFFAKVDFTVTNNGTDPFDVSSHDFEFYDADNVKGELDSKDFFGETIQAGKSAKGSAYFNVQSEGNNFEIYFADTSWTGEYQ